MDRRAFCRLLPAATAAAVGGSLFLPHAAQAGDGSIAYTVQRGDTLSGIAHSFGTSVRSLQRANGLRGDLIRTGEVLRVPGGAFLLPVRQASEPMRGGLRTWRYIVAHHSAVDTGNAQIYGDYHKRRGMQNGLAYHFVIGNGSKSGDGEIEMGDRWFRQLHGGHVSSHEVNERGIGICLVGNFENHPPTARQMAALHALVAYLRDLVPNRTRVAVHREIDGRNHTVCPGRYFPTRDFHARHPNEW